MGLPSIFLDLLHEEVGEGRVFSPARQGHHLGFVIDLDDCEIQPGLSSMNALFSPIENQLPVCSSYRRALFASYLPGL
jgi:hypothetical protein